MRQSACLIKEKYFNDSFSLLAGFLECYAEKSAIKSVLRAIAEMSFV
jgi:hypothetical protein